MAGVVNRPGVESRSLLRAFAAVAAAAALAGGTATVARPAGKIATLEVGDAFVAKGQTGRLPGAAHDAVGVVIVRGSWSGGPWHVLTTTRTDAAGRYRFRLKPQRRGRLAIRITPPDNQVQRFVLRVV